MRITLTVFVIALGVTGCKNPGADVAPATVEPEPAVVEEVAAVAPVAVLEITPENSKVEFVGAKVTRSHPGGFSDFGGKLQLADPPENSQIDMTIQTATLFADDPKLTKHLKSPDFFDVEKFPTATFTSADIKKEGAGHVISGDLTLHGVTKRISFPATITVTDGEVKAVSEFSINRKDFGLVYPGMPDDLIRDLVVVKLSLALPRRG